MPSNDLNDLKYDGTISLSEKAVKMLEDLKRNPPQMNDKLSDAFERFQLRKKEENGQ